MNQWIEAELSNLRSLWPDLIYKEAGGHHWVLLPSFAIPAGWNKAIADLVVRIPVNLPGEQPYAFWIKDGIALATGAQPTNYTLASEAVPFSESSQWGQFSWSYEGWTPPTVPGQGPGMVQFVQSVSRRLGELN